MGFSGAVRHPLKVPGWAHLLSYATDYLSNATLFEQHVSPTSHPVRL